MSQEELELLFSDCVYDTCVIGGDNDDVVCTQAENLIELCESEYGVTDCEWRSEEFCGKISITRHCLQNIQK